MTLPEEKGFVPCEICESDFAETFQRLGRTMCEDCYNAEHCGCLTCRQVAEGNVWKKGVREELAK
jgi:hypothetical protein